MAEMVLTREEVREASRSQAMYMCDVFPDYDAEVCDQDPENFAHCALCKKLTEFASLQDPVGKGEEDE